MVKNDRVTALPLRKATAPKASLLNSGMLLRRPHGIRAGNGGIELSQKTRDRLPRPKTLIRRRFNGTNDSSSRVCLAFVDGAILYCITLARPVSALVGDPAEPVH